MKFIVFIAVLVLAVTCQPGAYPEAYPEAYAENIAARALPAGKKV